MRIYRANIASYFGDLIIYKTCLDQVKNNFDQIFITYNKFHIKLLKNDSPEYWKFLDDIGKLFFTEPPFILNKGEFPYRHHRDIIRDLQINPVKPDLKHLLCKGQSLNVDEEYIVITTKVRYFPRNNFNVLSKEFFNVLSYLSQKYKIVVMGERVVERNIDYANHGIDQIYSIYDEIIANISPGRLIDLTIPALGLTSPQLNNIQQDCFIMNAAKCVITLGIGGNLFMALAVANTIAFRADDRQDEPIIDLIFQNTYPDAFFSRDWNAFITKLAEYF
jgi:hypothetical protein